jgi:hypothetical protein
MIVLCSDKIEISFFVKIPAKYADVSNASVMAVGRGDQQHLTKHLKAS